MNDKDLCDIMGSARSGSVQWVQYLQNIKIKVG